MTAPTLSDGARTLLIAAQLQPEAPPPDETPTTAAEARAQRQAAQRAALNEREREAYNRYVARKRAAERPEPTWHTWMD
jgi:hypothetical protein